MIGGGAMYTPTVQPKLPGRGDENGLLDSEEDTDIELQQQQLQQQQHALQTKFT